MVRKAIVATRQLAKRQITWLRRETDALWYDPTVETAQNSVIGEIARFLDL
jgi:tRNA dimethylallyltransferase